MCVREIETLKNKKRRKFYGVVTSEYLKIYLNRFGEKFFQLTT